MGALALPAGASAETCGTDDHLATFTIVLRAEKPVYRPGETAAVLATVTRVVAGHSVPAENVEVLLGIYPRRGAAFGAGVTDETGTTAIAVELPRKLRPGPADASAIATKKYAEVPCHGVSETGFVEVDDFLLVR